jgi:adenosylhomocysteinase
MAASGALQVPCLAVNDAPAKLLFDNGYGTGQSVVMAILDVTNTQMPGKHVVVMGYGPVGAGIARCARALGARVTVTEIDPIAALRALHDGHGVATWHEAAGSADVVVTATGIGRTLTAAHLADVKDGAIVAVGGAGPPELDLSLGPAVEDLGEVRPRIRAHRIGVTTFFVLADGECVNCAAAEGNPIEIMDLSLALQLHALDHLARHSDSMEPGVHELAHEISERVAVAQLSAAGRSIDQPTVDQVRATASW